MSDACDVPQLASELVKQLIFQGKFPYATVCKDEKCDRVDYKATETLSVKELRTLMSLAPSTTDNEKVRPVKVKTKVWKALVTGAPLVSLLNGDLPVWPPDEKRVRETDFDEFSSKVFKQRWQQRGQDAEGRARLPLYCAADLYNAEVATQNKHAIVIGETSRLAGA